MDEHALGLPCYLKGVSEVGKEKVDCTVKLGSSMFPAHTQVLCCCSPFLADLLDTQLGEPGAQSAAGAPVVLEVPVAPLKDALMTDEPQLATSFESLLQFFYGAEQPTLATSIEAAAMFAMLRMARYMQYDRAAAVCDAKLWFWMLNVVVPSLPSTFDLADMEERQAMGEHIEPNLGKLGEEAAVLLEQAAALRLTLCTAALLPWALRHVNLGASLVRSARIPGWGVLRRLVGDASLTQAVQMAQWGPAGALEGAADAANPAPGVDSWWEEKDHLYPALDMIWKSEWEYEGPQHLRLTDVPRDVHRSSPSYTPAARLLARCLAGGGWGHTPLPEWFAWGSGGLLG